MGAVTKNKVQPFKLIIVVFVSVMNHESLIVYKHMYKLYILCTCKPVKIQ